MVIMTVKKGAEKLTLEMVMREFGLEKNEVNLSDGLINAPGGSVLFCIKREAVARMTPRDGWEISGLFSNPDLTLYSARRKKCRFQWLTSMLRFKHL